MAQRRMTPVDLARAAGWRLEELSGGGAGTYRVKPAIGPILVLHEHYGGPREERNAIAALRRAGVQEAIRERARREERRRKRALSAQARRAEEAAENVLELSRRAPIPEPEPELEPDPLVDPGDLLSMEEVAEALGLAPTTVKRHVRLGDLPASRVPGRGKYGWRYAVRWADVVEYATTHEVPT